MTAATRDDNSTLPVRVGKLESSFADLRSDVTDMRGEVKQGFEKINVHLNSQDKVIGAQGRPNWVAWGAIATLLTGVLAAVVTIVLALGAYLFNRISETQREAVMAGETAKTYADKVHEDMLERFKVNEDRLTRWIEREQDRNNKLEREMGATLKVQDLYEHGLLKLRENNHAH